MAYSAISKPQLHFDVLNYTGNGATSSAGTTARTLTGLGFQPSWVWVKEENDTEQHFLQDAVRGVTKVLASNVSGSESDCLTDFSSGGVNTFTSDGYTIGSGTGGNSNNINTSGNGYRSYCWKGAGAGSSNTDGAITSTVSANATAGFSIVRWDSNGGNNATVGHGLGAEPKIIIYKAKNNNGAWYIWLNNIIENAQRNLNFSTAAKSNINSGTYGSPSSTTISNFGFGNTEQMIAYCFAEKKGYSKFGSYIGNGLADGSFVYTGFKPAFVTVKSYSTSVHNWCTMDIKNDGFNPTNKQIHFNTSGVETLGSGTTIDILSNGFKMKTTDGDKNGNGTGYIYWAVAAEPLVANVGQSIPATAR